MQTAAIEDGRRLGAEAVRDGFEIIVAAGGDGTLNEVLNGIADVPDGFQRARLGVLPLGTVNVFARELGIPRRFDRAWQTILEARETRVDLPVVEYAGSGARSRRCFAQLAGAGLDARAIELVHWPLKKRIGPLAYVVAGLNALLQRPSKITVTDGRRTVTGELVLIGNGRLYGGEFRIFPEADLRDGLLDVCVFPRVNWLTLARCCAPLMLRRRLPLRETANFRSATFTLSGSPPAPLEVDGEFIGHVPATFSIQRSGLRVIVP
jgi:YegS/Rv2252/BmrU family lipid kinase